MILYFFGPIVLPLGKIVVDFVLVGRIDWYLGETSAKNSNFRRRRPPAQYIC